MEKVEGVSILELPLKVDKWQEDIMNKRFETTRKIYNIILSGYIKRYKELSKTKLYRDVISKLNNLEEKKVIQIEIREFKKLYPKSYKDKKEFLDLQEKLINTPKCTLSIEEQKEYKIIKNKLLNDLGINEYGIYGKVNSGLGWKMAEFSKTQGVNPTIINSLCNKNLWKSISSMVFKGNKNTFKKYGELNCVYGGNVSGTLLGIGFDGKNILWRKAGKKDEKGVYADLKLAIDKIPNEYEAQMLSNKIIYVGIVRKMIRGRYKYYTQFTVKGIIPSKINKETGKFRKISNGKVGLDIGTSTLAIVSDNCVKMVELAEKSQPNQNENRILQRKIDRSVRISNPNKFNEDGTIVIGNRDKWIFSKNCIRLKAKLKENSRKLSAIRKNEHEHLANMILSLGNECYIEKMRWSSLSKRSKNEEVNDKGRMKKRKRFGKTIGNRAPYSFMSILDNKLKSFGKSLININTQKCRASQYNQFTDEYIKKSLNQRWNVFPNGDKVQRDLYSAFLIQNTNDDLISFNNEQLAEKYQSFKQLHDIEIERISNLPKKQLLSFGVN